MYMIGMLCLGLCRFITHYFTSHDILEPVEGADFVQVVPQILHLSYKPAKKPLVYIT